jgi:hypothetical protein
VLVVVYLAVLAVHLAVHLVLVALPAVSLVRAMMVQAWRRSTSYNFLFSPRSYRVLATYYNSLQH